MRESCISHADVQKERRIFVHFFLAVVSFTSFASIEPASRTVWLRYCVAADIAGTGELHHFRSSPTGSIIPAAVAALCNLCLFFRIYN